MKKALLALAAAFSIAVATVAVPTAADARCRTNCVLGIAAGAAILGGIAAGAHPGYAWGDHYYPVQGYVSYGGYYEPAPVGCPGGYWARQPRYDRWGNQIGWSRPRFFCPY